MMNERKIRRLPVMDKGKLAGIVTKSDIYAALGPPGTTMKPENAKRRVEEFMTENPLTIGSGDTLEDAALKMLDHRISGLPVMDEPLRRRKSLLRQTVRIQGTLAVPDFVEREGVAFFEAARAHALEGVIAKERDSRYTPGIRSRSWLSMRVYQRSEFVIGGYTYGGAPGPGHGAPATGPFTSLLIGQFDASGALRFVGEVSGGLDAASAADVVDALDAIRSPEAPFAGRTTAGRLVFWCRPELAVTARFAGWCPKGRLRFPLLEWLRPDVPVEKCRLPERSAQ